MIKLSGKKPTKNQFQLSLEQTKIIESVVKNHQNVIVNAVAGSGKTTTILEVIKSLKKHNHPRPTKALVLMFNKPLQEESFLKAKKKGVSSITTIKTFHSFVNEIQNWLLAAGILEHNSPNILFNQLKKAFVEKMNLNPTTSSTIAVKEFLEALLENIKNSPEFVNRFIIHNSNIPFYDLICFDETQDLYADLSWNIIKIIIEIFKKRQKSPRYIFVGDENQSIYEYNGADPRFISLATFLLPDLKFINLDLSVSFRITSSIATFVQKLVKPNMKITSFDKSFSEPVNLIVTPNLEAKNQEQALVREKFKKMIADEIATKIKTGLKPNEIFVLTRSNLGEKENVASSEANRALKFVDELRKFLYQKYGILCSDDNETSQDKVNFLTMHKSKGLEAKHVILLGLSNKEMLAFEDNNFTGFELSAPNLHYVALTRATKSMSIYITSFDNLAHSPLPAYLINKINEIQELQNEKVLNFHNYSGKPDDFIFFDRDTQYNKPPILNLLIEPSQIDINDPSILNEIKSLTIQEGADELGIISLPDKIKGAKYNSNAADVIDLKMVLGSLLSFITYQIDFKKINNQAPLLISNYNSNHIHSTSQPCLREIIDLTLKSFLEMTARSYTSARLANIDPLIDFFEDKEKTKILKSRLNLFFSSKQKQLLFEGELLTPLAELKEEVKTLSEWTHFFPKTHYPKLNSLFSNMKKNFGPTIPLVFKKIVGIFDIYTENSLIEIKSGLDENLKKAQIQLIFYAYFLQLNNELLFNQDDLILKTSKKRKISFIPNPVKEVLKNPELLIGLNLTSGSFIILKNDPRKICAIAESIIINYLNKSSKISDYEFINLNKI